MIWVSWRQHRAQLLFGAVVLGLIAIALVWSGLGIWGTFRNSGLAGCLAVPGGDCSALHDAFESQYSGLQFTIPLFLVLPALLGVFWGAPLVAREVEQGTHRLAWTQGVTRTRWLGTKVLVLVAATVAGAASLAWLVSWWSRPFITVSDVRMSFGVFDLRGIVPIAYALFALALGVASGVLIRRTVAAMAVTFGVYALVRAGVEFWVRPHYATAKTITYPFLGPYPRAGQGDWVLASNTLDRAGHVIASGQRIDLNVMGRLCPGLPAPGQAFPGKDVIVQCVQRLGLQAQDTYQPGSRFWMFQGVESAIFVGLALGLLAFSVWWVRHRVA